MDGPIIVQNLTLTNNAGQALYPIDFKNPLVLHAVSINNSTTTYNTLKQDVLISDYTAFFSACKFHDIIPQLFVALCFPITLTVMQFAKRVRQLPAVARSAHTRLST